MIPETREPLQEVCNKLAEINHELVELRALERPVIGGGGAGAPNDASYIVLANHAGLTAERRFVDGTDLTGVDAGANSTYTLNRDNTAVVPGTYGSATSVAQITVNQRGHITAAANVGITCSDSEARSMATSAVTRADSQDTSQSTLISIADSKADSAAGNANDSIARSMATSAASTATSQDTSQSTLIAAADSKAVSAGTIASTASSAASIADSKSDSAGVLATTASSAASVNLVLTDSQNTSQSTLISNALSTGTLASSAASANLVTTDSQNTSQSTLISIADSKAVSAATAGLTLEQVQDDLGGTVGGDGFIRAANSHLTISYNDGAGTLTLGVVHDIDYNPTGIEFGNTNQSYDVSGTTWVSAVAGGTLGGIPDAGSAGHTLADCLSAIATAMDGNYLAVREASGAASATNPLTVHFLFSSITHFDTIKLRSYYVGNVAHNMNIQLWNFSTGSWDTYATFSGESGYVIRTLEVLSDALYISGGVVKLQFIHTSTGNTSHRIEFDYVVLSDGGGGSGAMSASAVSYSPTGGITATNVQTAIDQLDSFNTSQSLLISTATTNASTADSKAESAVSKADSQNTSQSTLIATADSKGVSAGTLAATASSAASVNLVRADSQDTSQSTLISNALSTGTLASSAASTNLVRTDSQDTSQSTLISNALSTGTLASSAASANLVTTNSQNTSQSTLISTATTNAGTADSKAESAVTRANSQDTSQSTLISNALSTGTLASSAASANLVTTNSQNTSQSTLIATADSKGTSAGAQASTNLATTNSQNTSQSTLISTATANAATADSKALSVSVLTSTADSKALSAAGTLGLTAAPGSDHSANGILIVLTANEAQAFGDAAYITSGGKAALPDADAIATAGVVVLCADATISSAASGNYLVLGVARDDTWNWTVGGMVYLSTSGLTGSTLTQTAPSGTDDVIQILGVATHGDRMLFIPNLVQVEHT